MNKDFEPTFGGFIKEVNAVHANTTSTTVQIPIILYHNVIKNNTETSNHRLEYLTYCMMQK